MFSNLECKCIFREEVTLQVQTSETKISNSGLLLGEDDGEAPPDSIKTRCRTKFTGPQLNELERAFKENRYPDLKTR